MMQWNVTKRAFHQPGPRAVYDADVFSKTLEHLKLELTKVLLVYSGRTGVCVLYLV